LSVLGEVFALSPELQLKPPIAALVWTLRPLFCMLTPDKDWRLAPLPFWVETLALAELLPWWCYDLCDFELE